MYEGSCLCGGVRYRIDGELEDFGCCHCKSCQKASGSAYAANVPVERNRLHWVAGAELIKEFQSSPEKVRAFCGNCGSPLYACLTSKREILRVRLGSLDTPFDRKPLAHAWMEDAGKWEPVDEDIPRFEQWAPKSVLNQRGSKQPG